MLRAPRHANRAGRRRVLTEAQPLADRRPVPIDGGRTSEAHHLARRRKPRRVAELRGDGQCGEVIDPAETAEPRHPWREWRNRERGLEIRSYLTQPRDNLVNRP